MKKTLCGAILAALMATAAQAQSLQLAAPFTDTDAFVKAGQDWAGEVSKATDGAVDFEIVPNGALAPMAETLDAVSFGVVPAGMLAGSFVSGTIPALGYIELIGGLPVENPSAGEALAAIWDDLDALFSKHNAHLLWGAPAFNIGFICREGFLKSHDDWKGKNIRTAGRWQSQQIAALGAVPVPLAPSEIYVALQNGVVDCALMIPSITLSARLYEVAPYYTDTGLPANITLSMINMDTWNGFTEEQRSKIDRISAEWTQKLAVTMREQAQADLETLDGDGEVYTLSQEEQAEFIEYTRPIFEKVSETITDGPGTSLVKTLSTYR